MNQDTTIPTDADGAGDEPTVAQLQAMLSEADAAEAPAIADRLARLLGESLDASAGDAAEASP